MAERIVIEDEKLARQLQHIARREHRTIEEVLVSMVAQYQPQLHTDKPSDPDELARQVYLNAYERAREYWRSTGDIQRAALTDEQLDQEFWLFDADGIPRLKADQEDIQLPENSLHRAWKALGSAGFRSGQSDISARSREILDTEFADYLLSRINRSTDDASTPTD